MPVVGVLVDVTNGIGGPPVRRRVIAFAGLVTLAVLALTGCGLWGSDGSAEPGCPQAKMAVGSTPGAAIAALRDDGATATVKPGETINLAGSGFDASCGRKGAGDGPLKGIRLFVVQGDQRVSVAQVDATGSDRSLQVAFGVPPQVKAGSAKIVAQIGVEPDRTPLVSTEVNISS